MTMGVIGVATGVDIEEIIVAGGSSVAVGKGCCWGATGGAAVGCRSACVQPISPNKKTAHTLRKFFNINY